MWLPRRRRLWPRARPEIEKCLCCPSEVTGTGSTGTGSTGTGSTGTGSAGTGTEFGTGTGTSGTIIAACLPCTVLPRVWVLRASGIVDQSLTNPISSCPQAYSFNGRFHLYYKGLSPPGCTGAGLPYWESDGGPDLSTCVSADGVTNPCTSVFNPQCDYFRAPAWTLFCNTSADGTGYAWFAVAGDVCGNTDSMCISFFECATTLNYIWTGGLGSSGIPPDFVCTGVNLLTYNGSDGPNTRGSAGIITIEPG
jgi:hypothetical protein